MSDASAEAERLMSALRSRGYPVVEVPLALLVGRVSVQRPALILCDVDAPGALDQVKRLRDVPGGGQVDIVFLGEAGRTLDELRDEVFHEASGFFVRPVDTFGLLRKVEALIGPPSTPGPGAHVAAGPSSRPPPALAARPPSNPNPLGERPPSSPNPLERPPSSPEIISERPSKPREQLLVPPLPELPGPSEPIEAPNPTLPSTNPPKAAPTPKPASGPSSLPPSRSSSPPVRIS